MSIAQTITCAVCLQPYDGIPCGPPDAECCAVCWLEAQSYKLVRLRAHGPKLGETLLCEEDTSDYNTRLVPCSVVAVDERRRTATLRDPRDPEGLVFTVPWREL